MSIDAKKLTLSAKALREVRRAGQEARPDFINGRTANVVGMGVGVKWRGGEPTGDPALVVLVTQKLEKSVLNKTDLIPAELSGMQTDVLAIGFPFAYPFARGVFPAPITQELTMRVRPAKGGYSVSHPDVSAGTLGTCVYDILPGGTVTPPQPGVGVPNRYYLLSNNHVIANSNAASIGDPILQPGTADGGTDPADRIANLTRFIPIRLSPPVPLEEHNNLVDAAIAEGPFDLLNREVYWTGHVRGWRRKEDVTVGTVVQKTGRTTRYTTGRITVIDAMVDVNYGGGAVARFVDQIITTNMSAGGDSGSLVTTLDNVAVGLLFAGSEVAMIANQIENVRALLRVEVAEEIL